MSTEREMSLREWCDRLSEHHLVNRQRDQIIQTIALLNSMILSGEQHSETSQRMVQEALTNL